jgi:hypothetical protein
MLGARHDYLYGRQNLSYIMLVAVEEGLEMLGIVVFIYALLSYLGSSLSSLRILISDGQPKHTPAISVEINLPEAVRKVG